MLFNVQTFIMMMVHLIVFLFCINTYCGVITANNQWRLQAKMFIVS